VTTHATIARIFDDLRDDGGPGFAVAVLREGVVVHRECAGLADLAAVAPITPRTRFHIVSCSKTFTAAAVLILAARGRLDLEDCLSAHLADLPEALFATAPIRIRHLLGMTSGIRDALEVLRLAGAWRSTPTRVAEIHELIRANPTPQFRPGSRYVYTNANYVLLEALIERLAGQPADAFRAAEIYTPLGLADTVARYDDDAGTARLARPYVPTASGYLPATHLLGIAGDPIVSSLDDLTAWLGAWRQGRIGEIAVFKDMTAPPRPPGEAVTHYGLGMALRAYRGQRVWCHSGSQPGYKSHLAYLPDLDIAIVILSNREDATPKTRLPAIVDALAPDDLDPMPGGAEAPEGEAWPADGLYFDADGDELVWLERAGGRIEGETLGDPFTAYPDVAGGFRDRDDYGVTQPVSLRPATAGLWHLTLGGYGADYRRLPPYRPDAAAAAACIGVYEDAGLDARITVRRDDTGRLTARYGDEEPMDFPMQPLAPDLYLVRPTAPGIAFKHLFAFRRNDGEIGGVEVTMERLKQQWLGRRRGG
jgi:CubicO group peptidase (beta-lactamase class C family)